jgi:hypothetical protein
MAPAHGDMLFAELDDGDGCRPQLRPPGHRTAGFLSILATYASAGDAPALEHAIAVATAHRARLTVVVPIGRPSSLAFVDTEYLRRGVELEAERMVRTVVARVPDDVSLLVRCVPREAERNVALDLVRGAYDLYVARDGGRDPGTFRGCMGLRLMRTARRSRVAILVVPPRDDPG